jgi:acetyl esterase/lipase
MANLLRAAALLVASAVLPSCTPVDALNATVSTDGLRVTRDIAYAPGARGGLDVYRPDTGEARLPLVVFIYGGSWQSGGKDQYPFVAAPLARQGMVVAVPNYRLYPEVQYPGFIEDCARAVAFARAHAAEWGADPQRLYVVGHSAGGYNALMLATDARYLGAVGMTPRDLAGVVSIAGPADFLPIREEDIKLVFAPALHSPDTQPITHADGHNPPILLLHGSADTTVGPYNSRNLAARIEQNDGPVALKIYTGVGHIGIVTSFAPLFKGNAPVLEDVVAFIRSHPAPMP